jgi:hypothetical protein
MDGIEKLFKRHSSPSLCKRNRLIVLYERILFHTEKKNKNPCTSDFTGEFH